MKEVKEKRDTLHIQLGLVLMHLERIIRWIIILQFEIMYFTLIASQKSDPLAIRTPPEGGIRFKHFFFVYPVGDTVEDCVASIGCHSYMWRGRGGGRGDRGEVVLRDDIDVVLTDKCQRMPDRRPRTLCYSRRVLRRDNRKSDGILSAVYPVVPKRRMPPLFQMVGFEEYVLHIG